MKKIRNALFCLVICTMLCIPIANVGGSHLLKLWDLPEKSYLENRTYDSFHKPKVASYLSQSFQDDFESWVADHVPYRDNILLANASVQRILISTANGAFSFAAYPAFFGSQRTICPDQKAVYQTTKSATEFDFTAYETRLSKALHSLASGREGISWAIALPESSAISMVTPSHELVSNPLDYEKIADSIRSCLPDCFQFIDLRTSNLSIYQKWYFRTDHHMQISGAKEAYRTIIHALGKEPIEFGEEYLATTLPFFGANARPALITDYWDELYDVSYERSSFHLKVGGKKKEDSYLDCGYGKKRGLAPADRFESLYLAWFHGNTGIIEYENTSKSDGTLVLISDSFSNNCGRFYAENFRHSYEIDPRFYKGNISGLIDDVDADTVIIFLSQDSLDTESIVEFLGAEP